MHNVQKFPIYAFMSLIQAQVRLLRDIHIIVENDMLQKISSYLN